MSVNPGFGGQGFIDNSFDKIRRLKTLLKSKHAENVLIEIDGGIKIENIKEVSDAGCDIFVSGSGIFGAENPTKMISDMNSLIGN